MARARGAAIAIATLLLSLAIGGARASGAARVVVIALPEEEARALLARHPAAVGLGVAPPSLRAPPFVEAIGTGGPRPAGNGDAGRGPGALRRALDASRVEVAVFAARDAPAALSAALGRALGVPRPTARLREALAKPVAGIAVSYADDAEAVLALTGARVMVLGVGSRTPVLVADLSRRGLLAAGSRPRPAVLTPYDVGVTILRAAGARPLPGMLGRVLGARAHAEPLATVDALASRFERDESTRAELTVAHAAAVFGSLLAGGAALALRRRRDAARWGQAAAFALAGYVGALFVSDGRAWARVAPVVGAALLGLALPPSRRATGAVLLGLSGAIAVLAVTAALRPLGEPSLSLWGPPLRLSRFFGLLNHLVALMLGGLVAGAALLRLPRAALACGSIVVAAVAAAPTVGANLVSAIWIGVAAVAAVGAARSGRLRVGHVALGLAAGAVALTGALAAAAATGVSHGAGAFRRILTEGPGAAAELFWSRAELNVRHLLDQPAWFVGWDAFVVVALGAGVWWAARGSPAGAEPAARSPADRTDPAARAAVGALAAAALAALVAEDTGALMVSNVAAFAGIAFLLSRPRDPATKAPADTLAGRRGSV